MTGVRIQVFAHTTIGTIGTYKIFTGYLPSALQRDDNLRSTFLNTYQRVIDKGAASLLVALQELCVKCPALHDTYLFVHHEVEHLFALNA